MNGRALCRWTIVLRPINFRVEMLKGTIRYFVNYRFLCLEYEVVVRIIINIGISRY